MQTDFRGVYGYGHSRDSHGHGHDHRFPFLPFLTGLAVSPLLFGGGFGYGPGYGYWPGYGYPYYPPYGPTPYSPYPYSPWI